MAVLKLAEMVLAGHLIELGSGIQNCRCAVRRAVLTSATLARPDTELPSRRCAARVVNAGLQGRRN